MDNKNKEVDYCGIIHMIRYLIQLGYCTETEGRRFASYVAGTYDINIIYPL